MRSLDDPHRVVPLVGALARAVPACYSYIGDFDRVLEEGSKSQEFITYGTEIRFSPWIIRAGQR